MIGVLRANHKALGAAGGSSAQHGRMCAGKRPGFPPTARVGDWWHLGRAARRVAPGVRLRHADRRGAGRPAVGVPGAHVERALERRAERADPAGAPSARAGQALRGGAGSGAGRAARLGLRSEPGPAVRAGRAVLRLRRQESASPSTTWPRRCTRTPSCCPRTRRRRRGRSTRAIASLPTSTTWG